MARWCSITCVVMFSTIMSVSGASIRPTVSKQPPEEKTQNQRLLSLVLVLTKMVEEMVKQGIPAQQAALETQLPSVAKPLSSKTSGSHHLKENLRGSRRMNSDAAIPSAEDEEEESHPADAKPPDVSPTTESKQSSTSFAPESKPSDASPTEESKPSSDSATMDGKLKDKFDAIDGKLKDKLSFHGPMTSHLGHHPNLLQPAVQKDVLPNLVPPAAHKDVLPSLVPPAAQKDVSPADEPGDTQSSKESSEESSEESPVGNGESKLVPDAALDSEQSLLNFCQLLAEYPDVAKQFEFELMDIQKRFYEALIAQRVGKASVPPPKEKSKADSGTVKAEKGDWKTLGVRRQDARPRVPVTAKPNHVSDLQNKVLQKVLTTLIETFQRALHKVRYEVPAENPMGRRIPVQPSMSARRSTPKTTHVKSKLALCKMIQQHPDIAKKFQSEINALHAAALDYVSKRKDHPGNKALKKMKLEGEKVIKKLNNGPL